LLFYRPVGLSRRKGEVTPIVSFFNVSWGYTLKVRL